jgi:riboflavin kinase/FMN adenylyltransferase
MMQPDDGRPLFGRESGTVVTVGTFDGVHRGHWQLLERVRETAERAALPSVLVTFDPHPLAIVRPDQAPELLTTPAEKIEVLAESGMTYMALLRFDKTLASYSPERFVREILIARYAMRQLVIGYDHGFGRGRSGDVETLRRVGAQEGFEVEVVPAVSSGNRAISSSGIRALIADGDVTGAGLALGRPYSVRAAVVRGDGRGRTLGYPTANLKVRHPSKLIPKAGIYAAKAMLRDRTVNGVVHIGPRPTFPGAEATIELHLFDFDEDIYGAELALLLCSRIRDVQRFADIESLVGAMAADARAARAVHATGAGACGRGGGAVSING